MRSERYSRVSTENDRATVLIVDDEENVADVYALRLRSEYETRVAYGGKQALEKMDVDVDVVLLDRRMPDMSGSEVLTEIRERDYDCRVIILTAVNPDLEIIDMPFDEYLCKPVEQSKLVETIEGQLDIQRYDDRLSEYAEITSKLAVLQEEMSSDEKEQSPELEQLQQKADRLKSELDDLLDDTEITSELIT
jgi:DNA-binding response OmpR family regulator